VALICAEARLGFGDPEGAARWLERARNVPTDWRTLVEARLAQARGNAAEARRLLERGAETFPRNIEVQRAWVAAAIDAEGPRRIVEALKKRCAAHVEHLGLKELLFEVLRTSPAEAEARLVAHLEEHPDHRFAWIELIYARLALAKHEAAAQAAADAQRYVGREPISLTALAEIELARGHLEGAREFALEALTLDPDHLPALRLLPETGGRSELGRAAVQVHALLLDRGSRGHSIEGLFGLYRHLEPARVEKMASEIFDAYQEFPSAWIFAIQILVDRRELDEARSLALEGCARFESSAEMHGVRAFVEQLRGDFEAEVDARRDRLRFAPLEERFVAELAGALVAAGRREEARSLLEEYVVRLPRAGLLHAELGDLELAAGDPSAALDRYLLAIRTLSPRSAAWRQAHQLADGLGRLAELHQSLRALIEETPHRGELQIVLAETLVGAERRKALEEAISIDPGLVDARDLLALDLANEGRLSEARELCHWPSEENPALTLEGRLTWLTAEEGDLSTACATMERIVAEHPTYSWGIERLLEWYAKTGQGADRIRVSKLSLDAQPHSAPECMRHAGILIEEGAPGDAKPVLDRALSCDPTFEPATRLYVEILLNEGRTDEAASLVGRVESHLQDAALRALRARIEVRSGSDFEAVWLALEAALRGELAREDAATLGSDVLLMRLERAAIGPTVAVLTSAESPKSPRAVANFWCQLVRDTPREGVVRLLDVGGELNDAGYSALAFAIEDVATRSRFARWWLRMKIRRHLALLAAHPVTWGSVGYFYVFDDRMHAARDWLTARDWSEGVEPWMLSNLVEAAWTLGDRELAQRAVERALQMERDHTWWKLRAWAAFGRAIEGSANAREALDPEAEDDRPQAVWQMAKILIEARAGAASGDEVGAAVRAQLRRLAPSHAEAGDAAYEAFREAMQPWCRLPRRRRIHRHARLLGSILLVALAAHLVLRLLGSS